MGKVMLLAGLVAYGAWWYFHAGRQMDEASISALHARDMSAFVRLDAETLCDQLHDDYRSQHLMFTLAGTRRLTQGKSESCTQLTDAFRDYKRLSALTGGAVGLSYDQRVLEVRLSDDRKTATVEVIGRLSIRGRLLSRTHAVDTLIRRNGRIVHLASTGKSWVYAPAGS